MTRARIIQTFPPADLTGFPSRSHRAAFYRAARHAPWWFCTCGDCRFDLDGSAGRGTMYAGTDQITGVLETIGPELRGRAVAREFLAARQVSQLVYDRPVVVADLTAGEAIGFGVTNELSTMVPYEVPQAWADAFHDVGLDGIGYRTRFNTADGATGLALFDEAGGHPRWPSRRVCGADDPTIVTDLAGRGIDIEDPPTLAALTVLQ